MGSGDRLGVPFGIAIQAMCRDACNLCPAVLVRVEVYCRLLATPAQYIIFRNIGHARTPVGILSQSTLLLEPKRTTARAPNLHRGPQIQQKHCGTRSRAASLYADDQNTSVVSAAHAKTHGNRSPIATPSIASHTAFNRLPASDAR